jgi:hypothetical protein
MDNDFKTVRELIAELQKLDQDKHIWQVYDFPYAYWSVEIDVADETHASELKDVEVGDYLIICG